MDIKINKTSTPKMKPSQDTDLGFGTIFTDHMFIMDYNEVEKWHNPRIEKYGDISISPSAMVFHYGQSMFEGMKAYVPGGYDTYLSHLYVDYMKLPPVERRERHFIVDFKI